MAVTALADPSAVGFMVKAKETQGPPKLGGVAAIDTVVADTGAAVTSHGTLQTP